MSKVAQQKKTLGIGWWIVGALVFALSGTTASGDSLDEQALRLFNRLSGSKAGLGDPRVADVKLKLERKDFLGAADVPTKDNGFYNVIVYDHFAPLSVRSQSVDVPLNDFIAMGIANTMLKQDNGKDRPYTELLTGNFTAVIAGVNPPLPEEDNNNHYQDATNKRLVLTPANLQIRTPQRAGNFPDAAGLLTSRQFAAEHLDMGTNRRWLEYSIQNFLCRPIKLWRDNDVAFADDKVSREVDRRPGGDAAKYRNECAACHKMQDPLRLATAYFDFDNGQITYTPGVIPDKLNKNPEIFPGGFVVTDDFWENRLVRNVNATYFGWRGPLTGRGVNQLGKMITRARRFSLCTVEQVWTQVCRRAPNEADTSIVEWLGDQFEDGGYSLRELYKLVATSPSCMGIGN